MTGIVEIATAAVTLMAPFMPHLVSAGKAGGTKLVETIAEKGGEAAWTKAQALWNKIKSYLADTPELQGAALIVAAAPEDDTFRQALVKALCTSLQKHPEAAQELLELMGGRESVQAILIQGNSRGELISQDLEGSGRQVIDIRDGSSGKDIKQKITH